jgi:hypothetical protein
MTEAQQAQVFGAACDHYSRQLDSLPEVKREAYIEGMADGVRYALNNA